MQNCFQNFRNFTADLSIPTTTQIRNLRCPLLIPIFPQANPGVVTCLENTLHGLETGDQVTFTEVVGMSAINGTTHTVEGKGS